MILHKYLKYAIKKDQEGWNQKYKNEYTENYSTIDRFRFALLHMDASLDKINHLLINKIKKLREEKNVVNLLDVGCGTGHQIAAVNYLVDKAIGFDISKEVIQNNQKLNSNVNFIVGDALKHPKINDEITLCLMAGVLYAISDDISLHDKIIQEIDKTLSSQGYFIFYHRGYLSLFYLMEHYLSNLLSQIKGVKKECYSMSYYSDTYIIGLMDKNGFVVEEVYKDDFAFLLTQEFYSKIFCKKNKQKEEYISFNKLNFFGKFIYCISKFLWHKLTARTSIFVMRKKIKKNILYSENINHDILKSQKIVDVLTTLNTLEKNIYIFGAGKYAELFLRHVYNKKFNIKAIIDDGKKEYDAINKINIIDSKEYLKNKGSDDIIFICSSTYEDDIFSRYQYLEKDGVSLFKIFSLLKKYDIYI